MTQVLVFANQKGGVGKTTSSVNTAAGLGLAGKRVMLLDMDPQANASYSLTGARHPESNVYHLLAGNQTLDEIMVDGPDGVKVVPSDIDLAGAEVELPQAIGGQVRLRTALEEVTDFDYIIIDAPPSLGILTINALAAADGIIIPVDCSFFSLRGVALLEQTVEKVRTHLGGELTIFGVLATMFDHTNVAKDAIDIIQKQFAGVAFKTVIPKNVKLEEAHSRAKHIFSYAPDSSGAEAYKQFVEEIINRG